MRSAISTYRTPVLVIAAGRSRARNDMPFPAGSSACCESIGRRGGCGGVEGTTSNHASNCQVAPPMAPRRASLLAQRKVVTCARRGAFRQGGPRLRVRLTDLREASRFTTARRRRRGVARPYRIKKLLPKIVEYIVFTRRVDPAAEEAVRTSMPRVVAWLELPRRCAVPGAQTHPRPLRYANVE